MIELTGVSKTYGGKVKALDNVSLEIDSGCIYGFLGPNGAGKTTAIKLITGILKADAGTIRVEGIDIEENPLGVKKLIGFVPDDPNVFLRLKGIEYLTFLADIYGVGRERKDRIEKLAHRFEMDSALGDKILSYSHGMRQKIVIMGALLHQPPVWILDEPMTGLDAKASSALKQMMREHADEGNTVFFSTHVMEVAERLCDKVAVVDKGHILYAGGMEGMHSGNATLEQMFLEMTEHA